MLQRPRLEQAKAGAGTGRQDPHLGSRVAGRAMAAAVLPVAS